MDIVKPLLRLAGLPSRAGRKAKDEYRLSLDDPEPIHLSPSQREQIERRIAEFIEDSTSVHAHAHEAIARLGALPLSFGWTAFIALRPDGQIVLVPYDDEPGDIEVVREERLRNLGLFQGTKLHPELQFLLPRKPPDVIDYPVCQGTGKLTFPQGSKHLADTVLCACGGVGWLPHSEKP